MQKRKIFITGTAGFIGFHTAKLMLELGHEVQGYDNLSDYYDRSLKEDRHRHLEGNYGNSFSATVGMLEDSDCLKKKLFDFQPDIVIHLAAQAGVRYSLEHPEAYINSNIIGTFNLLEAIKAMDIKHFLMASTSSAYGSNTEMPFHENHKADNQLTIYSATKKSNESMCHAYSYINQIPMTIFRFFTVYGPWGRPDMALFKFTKGILENNQIDVYNNGDMFRDFTYIDDLVQGIYNLIEVIPSASKKVSPLDSVSDVCPYRLVNIGNSSQINLMDFIGIIEEKLQKKAVIKFMPMQMGDIKATLADNNLLYELTGFKPKVSVNEGVSNFIDWYIDYYKISKV
ncbi:GDP-mannose 4,6-dehydratase [bacterium]|nr:GDP-mannose 4,6-dehydratase [bacterium]